MDQLAAWAGDFGLQLDSNQLAQFATYTLLLQEWNERIALTAIRDSREIVVRHYLDSLTCAVVTGPLHDRNLIDVGSGGGFPGLPLKILYPSLQLTLVDSVGKKTYFLEQVARELGLSGITVLNERAETLGHDERYRESFDWAVARAVAELRVLVELLLPLCKTGGSMLAQKGASTVLELGDARAAIAKLGGGEATLTPIRLPSTEQTHYIVAIKKIAATDVRYPRRPGIPAKRPL